MLKKIGRPARLAAMALLVAAVLAPAAGAGRYPFGTPESTQTRQASPPAATCHQYCGATAPSGAAQVLPTHAVVQTELVPRSADAFRWADAAIGFAVACGAVLLVSLTVLAGRRARVRAAGGAS
jgi:hypothetical protein